MSLQDQIQQHIDDRDDPHSVNKNQLGLEEVENLPLASIGDANDGGAIERFVTPHRIRLVFDGYLKRNGLMDADGNPVKASVDAGF